MGEQRASAVNKLLIHRAKKNDQAFTPIEPIFVKYTVHEGNVRTFENEILGKDNTQIPEYLLIGLHTCGFYKITIDIEFIQVFKFNSFISRKSCNYEHGYLFKFTCKRINFSRLLLSYFNRSFFSFLK